MTTGLSPQHNCTLVKSFLTYRLGHYITNVTRAAEVCSEFLCQWNGRCVRRDPRAHHYLHLSADTYQIHPCGDGSFAVSGWPSQYDLQQLTERFRCHCFEGHEGDRCDSLNKVKEDDDLRRQENNEQERKRTEWEDEQGSSWERRESCALPVSCTHYQILLLLYFSFLLIQIAV